MNPTSIALCVLALGVGVAVGYGLAPGRGEAAPSLPSDLAEALEEENLLVRGGKLADALEGLNGENIEDSLAVLHERRVGVSDQELRMFMLAWARFDAPSAFEWAMAERSEVSSRLQQAAAYAWGFTDPKAALAVIENSPRQGSRPAPLMSELMEGWRVNGDVAGITAQLIATAPGKHRESMTTALLAQIGKQGLEAVIAWVDAIPLDADTDYKRVAFNRGAGVVGRADPERAARWYLANQGQPYTERSLAVIARRWVDHHDPPALFSWLGELPAPVGLDADPEQSRAISQGMKWWLRRDPAAAQAWINSFESVPSVYDPALGSLAQYYLKENPGLAVQWALKIQDEVLRTESLVRAARRWKRRDPDATAEWLATAKIGDATRERIEGTADRPATGRRNTGRRGRPPR